MKGGPVPRFGVEQMSNQNAHSGRDGRGSRLATPGATLGAREGRRLGHGVVETENGLIATKVGVIYSDEKTISVLPTHTRYTPRPGDLVIGVVEAVQSNLWFLDINAPFNALLPMSLGPGKAEFGGARNVLNVGQTVLCRIQEVDDTHSSVVTMKGLGLRRIDSGLVESLPPHLMQTLFSDGAPLKALKASTECRVILAENGRMWIDGKPDSITEVVARIAKIRSIARDISNRDDMVAILSKEVA